VRELGRIANVLIQLSAAARSPAEHVRDTADPVLREMLERTIAELLALVRRIG
jgi:hypothetical protein